MSIATELEWLQSLTGNIDIGNVSRAIGTARRTAQDDCAPRQLSDLVDDVSPWFGEIMVIPMQAERVAMRLSGKLDLLSGERDS